MVSSTMPVLDSRDSRSYNQRCVALDERYREDEIVLVATVKNVDLRPRSTENAISVTEEVKVRCNESTTPQ